MEKKKRKIVHIYVYMYILNMPYIETDILI